MASVVVLWLVALVPHRRARAAARPAGSGRPLGAPPVPFLARPDRGVVSVALGFLAGETARRLRDARLFLVSLAFITSAGFLGLHALATPGVLLEGKNTGFVVATPVGLFLAGGFAAASALDLVRRGAAASCGSRADSRTPCSRCSPPGRPTRSPGCRRSIAPSAAERGARAALTRSPASGPALRLRRVFATSSSTGGSRRRMPARDRRRVRLARGGDGRDRLQPQLARLLVGVARADGGRFRTRRVRRAERVPPPPLGRAVFKASTCAHRRPRRSALCRRLSELVDALERARLPRPPSPRFAAAAG